MSIFSGKCDFYDSVVAIHCDGDTSKLSEFLANIDVYITGRDRRYHKVEVYDEKTACKYYPYLTSIVGLHSDGHANIYLASDSFIDQEEREFLNWKINAVLKYWKKCKRKKIPFNVEECVSVYSWNDTTMFRKIAERVIKHGNKAEFDDLHDPMHERFRREWYKEMIRVGWSEAEAYAWCFKGCFVSPEEKAIRLGED